MDKCEKCNDGEMALKMEDSFFYNYFKSTSITYKGQVLNVTTPYERCDDCGDESIPMTLILEGERILRNAKRKADAMEKSK